MNKLIRLLSVLALASTVAFVSCKGDTGPQGDKGDKGDTGAPGTNGTNGTDGTDGIDGKDGNANLKSFTHTIAVADWNTVERASIGTAATSTWGGIAVSNAEITANKFVIAYMVVGEEKYKLPITVAADASGSEERLEQSEQTGQLNLYYRMKTVDAEGKVSFTFAPSRDLEIKYIVVEETTIPALRAAGVSTSDYDAVLNYLNQTVQVPVQL